VTSIEDAKRRLSVLIEIETDGTLIDTAKSFPSALPEGYARVFDRSDIELDLEFGALPVGKGSRAGELTFTPERPADLLKPENSEKFIIRGFVKGDGGLERLAREKTDGGLIFHTDPPIIGLLAPPRPTCGTSPYVGHTDTVRRKLHVRTLSDFGLDGSNVALAIVDTGIYLPRITQLLGDIKPSGFHPHVDRANSWKEHVVTEAFGHRLGHGTMCAYDALIAAPQATLLDYAMLLARTDGDQRLPATIAAAMRFYYRLIKFWILEPQNKYRALVISNSWGTFHPSEDPNLPASVERYIDNPNHIFRQYIQALAAAGADIIFSGSNCGPCCPAAVCLSDTGGMIMGANSYPEVLTIGGCDTNDELTGYSSRGPSIAGMAPNKPDLLAYTHFLGSKTLRTYIPDFGVSAACPVAAGCVAALRTRLSPATTPPANLFNVLRTTARKVVTTPGWDPGYGYGIINPVAAALTLGLIP